MSFTAHLWKCHRCNEGGDVYALVKAVHRCGFREALRFVAEFAGVRLENSSSPEAQRKMEERRRQRERVDKAADRIAALERALRLDCRDRIHECDRVLAIGAPWPVAQSQRAQAATELRDRYLLPTYILLSFGSIALRIDYVLADERTRAAMAAAVLWAGGTRTDNGHWREVLA